MVKYAIVILVLGALGYVQFRTRNRLRGQMTQLPADARWRIKVLFPAAMDLIIVAIFIAIFLLRLHS